MTSWREELAWGAGFFDGEGHIRADTGHGSSLSMRIGQNHREALDRFKDAVLGLGTITGPHHRPNGNDYWVYMLSSGHKVQAAVAMLWEFLGPVKREQAAVALSAASWYPLGYCRNGHKLSLAGRRADGRCNQCARDVDARRRERYRNKVSGGLGSM